MQSGTGEVEAAGLAPHARAAAEVVAGLATDVARGLDSGEVERRRAVHGANELARAAPESVWRRLARQFRQIVVLLLVAAAGVSVALGEPLDAAAILAIVVLNAVLGFVQEERATRAIDALTKLAEPRCRVRRDGGEVVAAARELVPGDVVLLEAGDAIPADARLVETVAFRAQEAALTGESAPIDKRAEVVRDSRASLAERDNSVYLGTVAAAGRAVAVVTATGMATELGRIARMLAGVRTRATPLQDRLDALSRRLALACLGIVAVVAAVYAARGEPPGAVLVLAIGLAVAAVPEGLPAVVTIALALGMRRLAERNALVRKLPAVETLGSVTVICTDKTGTLTRNEMTVREVRTASTTWRVTGSGYAPHGEYFGDGGRRANLVQDEELARALTIGARCNNARVEPGAAQDHPWTVIGDPTEGALLIAALKAGVPLGLDPGERVAFEIPFDSERRRMSVAIDSPRGRVVHAKGAAEALLPRCVSILRAGAVEPLDPGTRAQIAGWNSEMGARALRVLASAYREGHVEHGRAEEDLTFVALIGMQDPPRDEAPAAVATCVEAGIRPVMITGDQAQTALAIAREIGLARPGESATSGEEIDRWDDGELAARVEACPVIARASAEHKLRVVRAWRARGHVVAMTGDGVNDAPALQEADIGVAMGLTGTDVSRAAADMVLVDDNFASIVAAVREGRGIFDNVRKFVHYLLTANASEVLLMLLGAVAGWPVPLSALQLLWINLVTDGLPALALGIEPTERDVMRRRPLARGTPVVAWADAGMILSRGVLLTIAVALPYWLALASGDARHASAVAFAVLVFGQLAYVFAFRSRRATMPQLGSSSNAHLAAGVAAAASLQLAVHTIPPLRELFSISALAARDWFAVAGFSLAPVTLVELVKLGHGCYARRE